MGANSSAMNLAGDKFDKAHFESCKEAQDSEETCLKERKPIQI
jgi:hypothetical protein